jgi:hypothetical protein
MVRPFGQFVVFEVGGGRESVVVDGVVVDDVTVDDVAVDVPRVVDGAGEIGEGVISAGEDGVVSAGEPVKPGVAFGLIRGGRALFGTAGMPGPAGAVEVVCASAPAESRERHRLHRAVLASSMAEIPLQ